MVGKDRLAIDFTKYDIIADKPQLIRAKIESRHRGVKSTKSYAIFIIFDSNKRGIDSLLEHYCQCKNGSRTVGCCAHIMSIVW